MFRAIGRFSVKYRYPVIVAWVLLVIGAVFVMPAVTEFSMSTGFLEPGIESVDARLLMNEEFPEEGTAVSTANLVIYNKDGLNLEDEEYARNIASSVRAWGGDNVASVTSVFERPELRANLVSADNTAMLIPVGISTEAFAPETGNTVDAIRAGLPPAPAGTEVYVTGDAALGSDHMVACTDAFAATAFITLALITVILLVVYRSPVAPLVPLFTIGISLLVGLGAIGLLMDAGVRFSSFLQQFMVLIVFGAGTDYCLFMISRYREELAKGRGHHEAVVETIGRVGVVIASSAAVVAAGFAAMGFAEFEMFRTIGPGMALAVVILLLAGLTFTPALMASVRPSRLFWPAKEISARTVEPRFWARMGRWVSVAPIVVLLLGLVIMGAPLYKLGSMNRTFDMVKDLPATYESIQGHQVVADHFDLSEMLPVYVVINSEDDLKSGPSMQALATLSSDLSQLQGVTKVHSITQPQGEKLPVPPEAIPTIPELQPVLPYFVSQDGNTTRLMVGLGSGLYSNESYDSIGQIRQAAQTSLASNGLPEAEVLIGGATAEVSDLMDAMDEDSVRVAILVSIGVFVILVLVLQSLLAPLYILLSIGLTILTTLGVMAIIFQDLLDFRYNGVDWTVPLMLFIFLMVLAADYSIFLMSRIKEESGNHGLKKGVEFGVAHTGGVISACGLILAGTFAALIFTNLGSLIQMGVGITFGVLLDTFVVRPLVLPSLARLFGRWGWWPGKLWKAKE